MIQIKQRTSENLNINEKWAFNFIISIVSNILEGTDSRESLV